MNTNLTFEVNWKLENKTKLCKFSEFHAGMNP